MTKNQPDIVAIAALIGDRTRAAVLTALMADRALTATELAAIADVTKQTISAHLSKLVVAGLITVEDHGRHRYFRLADRDVAGLIESLMGVAFRTGAGQQSAHGPREPTLRRARVCYDHLAGEQAVVIYDALLSRNALRADTEELELTDEGRRFFRDLGVDTEVLLTRRRTFCRACLDWSERRHHLAGALGAALFERFLALDWARRVRGSRAVSITLAGERAFSERFGVSGLR